MSATEYIGQHPLVGTLVTVVHIVGAALLQVTHLELPLILMQLFQIGAWSIAMAAGLFTIYGVWKTHHGKKRK